jgi:AraC-like DNA-binding protein
MSESYFMNFFKRVTGLSFMEYLNHYSIERAQAMMVNTNDSIAEISHQLGFCDQRYFGVVFRRWGESPRRPIAADCVTIPPAIARSSLWRRTPILLRLKGSSAARQWR